MEELCEVGHKNCEIIFGVEEYYLGTKCFPSMPLCRTLVLLSSKPDNFMVDVICMCQEFGQIFFKSYF